MQRRADTESAIRTETRSLREVAGRLDPPVSDLDALAGASLVLETIARFRNDLEALALEVRRGNDRLAAATDAVAEVESRLRDLTSGPSPSVEFAETEQRDTDWNALRATLFGSSASLLGGRLAEVVASFERNSSEADQLADSAASDAKRVAAYAAETHRLAEERRKEDEPENASLACRTAARVVETGPQCGPPEFPRCIRLKWQVGARLLKDCSIAVKNSRAYVTNLPRRMPQFGTSSPRFGRSLWRWDWGTELADMPARKPN